MINFIGGVFKYTLAVLGILVFSHIIEIKGVSISQHVLNGMHGISGFRPDIQANRITASLAHSVQGRFQDIEKLDPETSTQDQKALNHVIEASQHKK